MQILTLKGRDGENKYINVDKISYFYTTHEKETRIVFSEGVVLLVKETPPEIRDMIR